MNLGERLSQLRRAAGLTQKQLGESSGYERSYIAQIETGVKSNLKIRTIQNLATALGIKVVEFLKGTDCE